MNEKHKVEKIIIKTPHGNQVINVNDGQAEVAMELSKKFPFTPFAEVEKMANAMRELKSKNMDLEIENQELRFFNTDLDDACDELREQRDALDDLTKELNDRIDALEKQNAAQAEQINNLRNELRSARRDKHIIPGWTDCDGVCSYREGWEQAKKDNEQLKQVAKAFQEQSKVAYAKLDDSSDKIVDLEIEKKRLQQLVNDLTRQVQDRDSIYQRDTAELNRKIAQANELAAARLKIICEKNDEIYRLQGQIREHISRCEDRKITISDLEAELAEYRDGHVYQSLRADAERLAAQLEDAQETIATMRHNRSVTTQRVQENEHKTNQQIINLREDLSAAQCDLRHSQLLCTAKETALMAANTMVKDLRAKLKEAEDGLENMRKCWERQACIIRDKNTGIARLQEINKELKEELKLSTQFREELEYRLHQLELGHVPQLSGMAIRHVIDKLNAADQAEALERRLAEYEKQIVNLQGQIEDHKAHSAQLANQLAAANTEIAGLSEKLDQAQDTLECFDEDLKLSEKFRRAAEARVTELTKQLHKDENPLAKVAEEIVNNAFDKAYAQQFMEQNEEIQKLHKQLDKALTDKEHYERLVDTLTNRRWDGTEISMGFMPVDTESLDKLKDLILSLRNIITDQLNGKNPVAIMETPWGRQPVSIDGMHYLVNKAKHFEHAAQNADQDRCDANAKVVKLREQLCKMQAEIDYYKDALEDAATDYEKVQYEIKELMHLIQQKDSIIDHFSN